MVSDQRGEETANVQYIMSNSLDTFPATLYTLLTADPPFATSRPLSPDALLMPRPKTIGPSKPVHAGTPAKGRIKLLIRGQGCGIISASCGDVFFHKTEVQGKFWDLKVGDRVVFELLDDSISGPRAQHVQAARSRKAR